MNNDLFATLHLLDSMTISGRGVWFYCITSSVGEIYLVQYEQTTKELITKLFYYDYLKANREFKLIGGKILKGVI